MTPFSRAAPRTAATKKRAARNDRQPVEGRSTVGVQPQRQQRLGGKALLFEHAFTQRSDDQQKSQDAEQAQQGRRAPKRTLYAALTPGTYASGARSGGHS